MLNNKFSPFLLYNRTNLQKYSFIDKFINFNSLRVGQVVRVNFFIPTKEGLKFKTIVGLCLSKTANGLFSSILLRNSYRTNSIEQKVYIYSPLVDSFNSIYTYRKKIRLSKIYFVRNVRQKNFK